MAKKNKNKQPNKSRTKPDSQVQPTLTDDQKLEIEVKKDELEKDNVLPVEQLSSESEIKLKESEAKDDLVRYWNYVKEINLKLERLINSVNSEKEEVLKQKEEIETSKRETEAIKTDLKKKLDEYNRKDKEITEREMALDNGEYTGVIRRLLDTIKDTEKKVFTDTENLLKELSAFHKTNLEELSKSLISNSELEKQINEFKKEKKRFEIDKADFEDNIRDEFSNQLKEKTKELERLQRKFAAIEEENKKLKQTFEDLESAFDSTDPQKILMQNSFMKGEINYLKRELNERPEQYELDGKQAKIEELQAKVTEFQEKINEGELLELKRILSNMDSYVIEINAYKNQIESAKVREASLKKTIDDLSVTIDQLKGESLKKADAFEFAKKCDADKEHLGKKHLGVNAKQPTDLKTLVSYVQYRMANKSDEPFKYTNETIRIFLSGLHMSQISILQGNSGTGKTSLAREFAKALISNENYINSKTKPDNAPYRICAIQSGWRDNMDLMGYYNSFEHKYKETDFFKALYLANQPKYEDTLFLIILDEMNLSRPEHYFADFLSLLEQSSSERYINLTNTPNEVLPEFLKNTNGRLTVPENVRFIGTANHDETTLEFAPKTYDRSNLMEMNRNDKEKAMKEIQVMEKEFSITYSWLSGQFVMAESNFKKECRLFDDYVKEIETLFLKDKGIGVGNRLERQSERFISVYLHSGQEKDRKSDLALASDHLITSRLFRTLKNRYDLDKNNLTTFRDDYINHFKVKFGYEPRYAKELLDSEISKK